MAAEIMISKLREDNCWSLSLKVMGTSDTMIARLPIAKSYIYSSNGFHMHV
jgi:hypothetical protein